jgi:hypothetical protein
MKQSAVSWLIQNIVEDQTIKAKPMSEWLEIFEQSKSMEEQQIKDAYQSDRFPCSEEDAEQYFNETYGDNK